jgi:Na+-transporting NADH:ubiquinone oxidoreductase subunit A
MPPIEKIKIKKGLDLPITGEPSQTVRDVREPGTVAILGIDYIGMKPKLAVSVGETVKLGQLLFTDKKMPLIRYTSPGSGTVVSINRGEKRRLLSVVVRLQGKDELTFHAYAENELMTLKREKVIELLLESGLWTALRSRPFSKVADPEAIPHSLFITAMDTNPLAPSVTKILEGKEKDFTNGLTVLSRLTEGTLYLCKAPGDSIPKAQIESLHTVEFSGPHPAGNAGTHIHFLDPVNRNKQAWYINAQDVVAFGKLFTTGRLDVERVVSLSGPSLKNPRLITTRIGASLIDVTSGETEEGDPRVVSGSVLST